MRQEVDKKVEQAKKNVAQYEKKLTEIAPMVKEMERFAEKYSADPEEVLPEAGTLETGKTYREKKAKPLFKKIPAERKQESWKKSLIQSIRKPLRT